MSLRAWALLVAVSAACRGGASPEESRSAPPPPEEAKPSDPAVPAEPGSPSSVTPISKAPGPHKAALPPDPVVEALVEQILSEDEGLAAWTELRGMAARAAPYVIATLDDPRVRETYAPWASCPLRLFVDILSIARASDAVVPLARLLDHEESAARALVAEGMAEICTDNAIGVLVAVLAAGDGAVLAGVSNGLARGMNERRCSAAFYAAIFPALAQHVARPGLRGDVLLAIDREQAIDVVVSPQYLSNVSQIQHRVGVLLHHGVSIPPELELPPPVENTLRVAIYLVEMQVGHQSYLVEHNAGSKTLAPHLTNWRRGVKALEEVGADDYAEILREAGAIVGDNPPATVSKSQERALAELDRRFHDETYPLLQDLLLVYAARHPDVFTLDKSDTLIVERLITKGLVTEP